MRIIVSNMLYFMKVRCPLLFRLLGIFVGEEEHFQFNFLAVLQIYRYIAVTRRYPTPHPHPTARLSDPVLREVVKVTSLNRIMAGGCRSYANAIPLQASNLVFSFLMSHRRPLNVVKESCFSSFYHHSG